MCHATLFGPQTLHRFAPRGSYADGLYSKSGAKVLLFFELCKKKGAFFRKTGAVYDYLFAYVPKF